MLPINIAYNFSSVIVDLKDAESYSGPFDSMQSRVMEIFEDLLYFRESCVVYSSKYYIMFSLFHKVFSIYSHIVMEKSVVKAVN